VTYLFVYFPCWLIFFCHAMLPRATIKIHLYSPKLVFNMTCRLRTWCFLMRTLRWQSIKIRWTSQLNILLFKNQVSTFKLLWMFLGKSMVKWLKRNIWKFKHYYKSWFFKRFKLTNLLFWLMDMYILTKGQGLEWHMYVLTNQFDYSDLLD